MSWNKCWACANVKRESRESTKVVNKRKSANKAWWPPRGNSWSFRLVLFAVRRWSVVVDAPRVRLPDLRPEQSPISSCLRNSCTAFSSRFPLARQWVASSVLINTQLASASASIGSLLQKGQSNHVQRNSAAAFGFLLFLVIFYYYITPLLVASSSARRGICDSWRSSSAQLFCVCPKWSLARRVCNGKFWEYIIKCWFQM